MTVRLFTCLILLGALPAAAQTRRSLLDSDPDVVYLEEHVRKPIELRIIRSAPIFGDKEGKRRLGEVQADQKVVLQAMTDKAYRVTARTGGNKVLGWVAPWAFASKDPDFVENLKKLYERQLEVARLIDEGRPAIGMTIEEIHQALGKPTKTTTRQTDKGRTGSWEFINYEEVPHYQYVRNPETGRTYRQLSHVTREEKGKIVIEFENEVATAIEESESHEGGGVKIIVPPVIWGW
ncbi:MAG: hypothetical protein ACQKBU_04590 [Verrucomicrobiales bacterium]